MSQYNLDEVSPLVISTSVASNVLTLTASGTTLADWDWLRDDIATGSSSVTVEVPDTGNYEMEVVTEGEASVWSRDVSSSPKKCTRTITLAAGAVTSLAVNIKGTDNAGSTPTRRQIIILKRKAT